jgi:tetratricopeptide (TPR) repeat protein
MEQGSVFISYRRDPDAWPAQMIYRHLRSHGWDAFLDTHSIDAGRFEIVILDQIGARDHFVAVITPAWLESVSQTHNWCRRELERALELEKNIVPVLIGDFSFRLEEYDVAALNVLKALNALRIHADYFDAGMRLLCERFLVQPSIREVRHRTAEEHFQQGQDLMAREEFASAVLAFDAAAKLRSDMPEVFNNRGVAKYALGDDRGALEDFDRAIALEPDGREAHGNRFDVLQTLGRLEEALDARIRSQGRIPRRELGW